MVKVFVSWSGARSHEVAKALAPWMKKVIQSADPWLSSDVERGVKWLDAVNQSLNQHSLGVICATPENASEPWLNFEAGALSRQLAETVRVVPYLLDFREVAELPLPLGQFNSCLADRSGTWDLVKTINNHAEYRQSESELEETFNVWWPRLEQQLIRILAVPASVKAAEGAAGTFAASRHGNGHGLFDANDGLSKIGWLALRAGDVQAVLARCTQFRATCLYDQNWIEPSWSEPLENYFSRGGVEAIFVLPNPSDSELMRRLARRHQLTDEPNGQGGVRTSAQRMESRVRNLASHLRDLQIAGSIGTLSVRYVNDWGPSYTAYLFSTPFGDGIGMTRRYAHSMGSGRRLREEVFREGGALWQDAWTDFDNLLMRAVS